MNVAVVGYRKYNNYEQFELTLKAIIDTENDVIISGGAKGTDAMAEKFANENNLNKIIHKAEWKKYGPIAGPIRNNLIIRDCDYLVAFVSKFSKGTYDAINKAKNNNKQVIIINID